VQITRLRLRNIRSYVAADLVLEPGTTLVMGDVGAGKTSLLYAIEMALFGFAEVDPTYLVRHQAPSAEVALTVADGAHTYELRRRFARKNRKGRDVFEIEENSFAVDGARTKYSATELRQRAIDLLGFPDNPNPRAHSDLWRWAVYVPQEQMRDVLQQGPEERLETVRKALGLEQFRTAADNAKELALVLRQRAEVREASADQMAHWEEDLARSRSIRDGRRADLERLREELAHGRERVAAATAELAEAEDARSELEADRREREEVERLRRTQIADIERWTEDARKRTEAARAAEGEAREADRRIRSLEATGVPPPGLRRDLEQLRVRLSALEAARRELVGAETEVRLAVERANAETQALERARAETERLRETVRARDGERPLHAPPPPTAKSVADIDAGIRGCEEEIQALVARAAEFDQIVQELAELVRSGVCPRCRQAVRPDEHGVQLERVRTDAASARARLEQTRAKQAELVDERAARERFERALVRWEEVEKRRADARANLAEAEARETRVAEAALAARSAMDAAETRLAVVRPRAAGYAEATLEQARLEEAIREAERRGTEIVRLREVSRAALDRAGLLVAEARALGENAERVRQEHESLSERTKTLDGRLARRAALDVRVEELGRSLEAARATVEEAVGFAARLESERRLAETRIGEAEDGLRRRGEEKRAADHLRALAAWLTGPFRTGVLDLERRLLADAQADFQQNLGRYFASLVDDPGLLARADPTFTPSVEIDGELTPAEALSGGERTALALAFRLALGGVVRALGQLRLDALFLDEPTDGFSPEQVLRMGELIEALAVPQIVIVSHEAQLASIADRVVRVEKADGRSIFVDGKSAPTAPAPIEPLGTAPAPRAAARWPARPRPRRVTLDAVPED
jgi:exonuclease SbcC